MTGYISHINNMFNHYKKGIIFALMTAVISGISVFYNKLVLNTGVDPLILNIFKNGGVTIVLSLIIFSLPNRINLRALSSTQWRKLIILGVIGGSLPFVLFFTGLSRIPAVNANFIHKTLFVWVALLAIPLLSENLNIGQVIGYLIIASSNFAIGGFSGFSGSMGEILVLAATILWSVENIIAKIILRDIDATVAAWGRMFFGVIMLLLIALFQNKSVLLLQLSPSQLLPIFGSVIFLTGYVLTWYHALKYAPATVVASVLILATPITNILTVIFITHSFPSMVVSNILLSVIGVLIIALFRIHPLKPINLSKTKVC